MWRLSRWVVTMAKRSPAERPIVRERINGSQFRLELFRADEDSSTNDWSGGFLVSGSLRVRLSSEHASNLARRLRAAVDNTVGRNLSGLSGPGE